jgi:rhamnopyranosyl-N-acetylglucosaminyl-diphospho-decaprenol beta-1,3/1,4-galactofuranosyltransferase
LLPSTLQADPGSQRVCAIVVTRNRRELLRRCLQALARQEHPVDQVMVVDNASDDGTSVMMRSEFGHVALLELAENTGGSGGFFHGMSWAHERGYDWLWLMDDDTIPDDDALRMLLAGAARAPGGTPLLVGSSVRWKDGRLHPMNLGLPRWRSPARLAEGVAHRLLLMRYMTFVSVAVHRRAVDRFGLPLPHYFVSGEDVEFTARVLRDEPGYVVPESRVYHWTPEPHAPDSVTGERFYYQARNSLLLLRGSAFRPIERFDYGRWFLRTVRRYLCTHWRDARGLGILARAFFDGMRGEVR